MSLLKTDDEDESPYVLSSDDDNDFDFFKKVFFSFLVLFIVSKAE
jgi:hypothetical protein